MLVVGIKNSTYHTSGSRENGGILLSKMFQEEALFELRFWLQILGDHGRFIHDSLAPSETENIKTASYFIKRFDQLLATARQSLDEQSLQSLLEETDEGK